MIFASDDHEVTLRNRVLCESRLYNGSSSSSWSVTLPLVQRVEASTGAGGAYLTIRGLFNSGNPVRLGPFTPEGSDRVEAVIRANMLGDVTPLRVTGDELRANGGAYHCAVVEVVDWWSPHFEGSSFADAWLTPPPGSDYESLFDGRRRLVRVVGVWLCDPTIERAPGYGGYGHMGGSRAELCAATMTEEPA